MNEIKLNIHASEPLVSASNAVKNRRGTALLMVLGVLALLAVIAIAYVAVGRGDRVTSSASIREQRIDDQRNAVAEYIQNVIAGDLFSIYPQHTDRANGNQFDLIQTELWDYPYTDSWMRSYRPDTADQNNGAYRFRPEGTMDVEALKQSFTGGRVDTRVPSDPWLAATEPTRFVNDANAGEWINSVVGGTWDRNNALGLMDWSHISNFAPDGAFVNLKNLRNNFTADPSEMRLGLTLFSTARYDGYSVRPDLDRPADWCVWQLGMCKPMADDIAPDNYRHVNNQYADCDGDGYADSRWFELVDCYDCKINGVINIAAAKWLLPRNGRSRLFIAARAVDLSALVNLNTSTDFVYPSGLIEPLAFGDDSIFGKIPANLVQGAQYLPMGITPASIDLRRLLMLSDAYQQFNDLGYNAIIPQGTSGDYGNYNKDNAALAGKAAYAAIRAAVSRGTRFEPSDYFGGASPQSPLLYPNISRQSFISPNRNPIEPWGRDRLYDGYGYEPSDAIAQFGQPTSRQTYFPFSIDSELDLRTFNGLNDSSQQSPLEQTTAGRGGRRGDIARFDPFRSGRPFALESRDRFETSSKIGPSPEAKTLDLTDIRRLVTTVNGSRPFQNGITLSDNPGVDDPELDVKAILRSENLNKTNLKFNAAATRAAIAPVDFTSGTETLLSQTDNQKKVKAYADLYDAYLSALAPYRDRDLFKDVWTPKVYGEVDGSSVPQKNPISYGYCGLEATIRIAASLTANAIDAIDRDSDTANGQDQQKPTVLAISLVDDPKGLSEHSTDVKLFDEFKNVYQTADLQLTPWYRQIGLEPPVNFNPHLYDLTVSDHNDPQLKDGTSSPWFVTYGIEPQPSLIEVSYYLMYTDAPDDAEGASDDIPGLPNPDPPPPQEITIDPGRRPDNGDYLGEILAFQLYNPFDTPVYLVGSDGKTRYYIEFGGQTYALVKTDDDTGTISSAPMALEPYETKVFYAISPISLTQMLDRFNNVITNTSGGTAKTIDDMRAIIKKQFGDNAQMISRVEENSLDSTPPLRPPSTDPFGASGTLAGSTQELLVLVTTDSNSPTKSVANLWRLNRTPSKPDESRSDILIDRLRDEDTSGSGYWPDLLEHLPFNASPGAEAIPGTTSADEGLEDNTGFSITFWRSVRRPTESNPTQVISGQLPPWCIEGKLNNAHLGLGNETHSLNKRFGSTSNNFGDQNNFLGLDEARFVQFSDMLNELIGSAGEFNEEISKKAKDKEGNPIGKSNSKISIFDPSSGTYSSSLTTPEYKDVAIRLHRSDNDANITLFSRSGDWLLPLAISPFFDPFLAGSSADFTQAEPREAAYFTLSEIAAWSSDYWQLPSNLTKPSVVERLRNLGHEDHSNSSNPLIPILRRGQLITDQFAPYIDRDADSLFDLSAGDTSLGNGVPLALNILTNFNCDAYRRAEARGSLTKAIPGKININTAPLAVLRTLPMLAPDLDQSWSSDPSDSKPWVQRKDFSEWGSLGDGSSKINLIDQSASDDPFDIAAAVFAYANKIDVPTRPGKPNGEARTVMEFAEDFVPPPSPTSDPSIVDWKARSDRLKTPYGHVTEALREAPGFRSEGELALAAIRSPRDPARPGATTVWKSSIDRLGRDGKNMFWPGLNSTLLWDNPPQSSGGSAGNLLPDEIPDDPAESSAILNAVLSSVSVRSDVFCVWFIIQGYTPADVSNLSQTDPMIPSLRKRFVMVVDRSNVTQKGQQPKVLLLREVPIE